MAAPGAALAGPPFVTDDPEPVEEHAWEVNYALTGVHDSGGSAAFLPQVDANYGPLQGVQLHMQPQAAYHDANGARSYGIGDTELGLKWRLTPDQSSEAAWMISVYPLVEVPTGSAERKLGAGAASYYLPVWLQRTWGRLTTYGGGGYWIDHAANSRNNWAGGWVALYQITPALQLGGEWYANAANTIAGAGSSRFNLGGIAALAKDYKLLFSTGRGLGNARATDLFSFYLGLQVAN